MKINYRNMRCAYCDQWESLTRTNGGWLLCLTHLEKYYQKEMGMTPEQARQSIIQRYVETRRDYPMTDAQTGKLLVSY